MAEFDKLLDQAAATLLKEAGLTGPDRSSSEPTDPVTATAELSEKVKAFTAVFAYAKDRAALTPKEKEPSTIERMRAQLSVEPAPEKSSRRKAKLTPEAKDDDELSLLS